MGKAIIKEKLSEILGKESKLDGYEHSALLSSYEFLAESVGKNQGDRLFIAEKDADDLRAVANFLYAAMKVSREQRDAMWELADTILYKKSEG